MTDKTPFNPRFKAEDWTPAQRKQHKLHMDRVARLGCIICMAPAQVHHITTGSGMARKNNDGMVLPLDIRHHTGGGYGVAVHAGVRQWEKNFGTQFELLEKVFKRLGYSQEYINFIPIPGYVMDLKKDELQRN